MSKTTRSPSRSDADVLGALRAAAEHEQHDLADGGVTPEHEQHDLADGGVTPEHVATYSSLAAETLADRLRDIDDAVRVRGLRPDTLEPRQSWLPAEEVDDGIEY